MPTIILTVQPAKNKIYNVYRLGMSMADSLAFQKPLTIRLLDTNMDILVNLACGSPPDRAFDLNDNELSDWIINNGFGNYNRGKPPKLYFEIIKANVLTFQFTGQVER